MKNDNLNCFIFLYFYFGFVLAQMFFDIIFLFGVACSEHNSNNTMRKKRQNIVEHGRHMFSKLQSVQLIIRNEVHSHRTKIAYNITAIAADSVVLQSFNQQIVSWAFARSENMKKRKKEKSWKTVFCLSTHDHSCTTICLLAVWCVRARRARYAVYAIWTNKNGLENQMPKTYLKSFVIGFWETFLLTFFPWISCWCLKRALVFTFVTHEKFTSFVLPSNTKFARFIFTGTFSFCVFITQPASISE